MNSLIDADWTKHAYKERLRRAEHERLCQKLKTLRPPLLAGLRQSLGDRLIALGMRLKVKPYAELTPSRPSTTEA